MVNLGVFPKRSGEGRARRCVRFRRPAGKEARRRMPGLAAAIAALFFLAASAPFAAVEAETSAQPRLSIVAAENFTEI